jgi:hypothetical protein
MHVRRCEEDEIQIPLHVGENRSRTWIITRTDTGLRLKHDHRHPDGSEEEQTQYGGDTEDSGTATEQSPSRRPAGHLPVRPDRRGGAASGAVGIRGGLRGGAFRGGPGSPATGAGTLAAAALAAGAGAPESGPYPTGLSPSSRASSASFAWICRALPPPIRTRCFAAGLAPSSAGSRYA